MGVLVEKQNGTKPKNFCKNLVNEKKVFSFGKKFLYHLITDMFIYVLIWKFFILSYFQPKFFVNSKFFQKFYKILNYVSCKKWDSRIPSKFSIFWCFCLFYVHGLHTYANRHRTGMGSDSTKITTYQLFLVSKKNNNSQKNKKYQSFISIFTTIF